MFEKPGLETLGDPRMSSHNPQLESELVLVFADAGAEMRRWLFPGLNPRPRLLCFGSLQIQRVTIPLINGCSVYCEAAK